MAQQEFDIKRLLDQAEADPTSLEPQQQLIVGCGLIQTVSSSLFRETTNLETQNEAIAATCQYTAQAVVRMRTTSGLSEVQKFHLGLFVFKQAIGPLERWKRAREAAGEDSGDFLQQFPIIQQGFLILVAGRETHLRQVQQVHEDRFYRGLLEVAAYLKLGEHESKIGKLLTPQQQIKFLLENDEVSMDKNEQRTEVALAWGFHLAQSLPKHEYEAIISNTEDHRIATLLIFAQFTAMSENEILPK